MRISDWSSDVCSSDLGEWLALSFADRVIAVSPSLAAQLRQSFPQRAHSIAYIPNGTSDLPGDADPALIFERLGIADGDFLLAVARSEEHTSELQSLMRISYAVFRLKNTNHI